MIKSPKGGLPEYDGLNRIRYVLKIRNRDPNTLFFANSIVPDHYEIRVSFGNTVIESWDAFTIYPNF